MVKKGIIILLSVLLLSFTYSLGRQVFDSLQVNKRLDLEMEELAALQGKNEALKKKLAEVQSPKFIEQQARDKLNFSRTGETIMVIPQKEIDRILGVEVQKRIETISNWQGWLKLFWK